MPVLPEGSHIYYDAVSLSAILLLTASSLDLSFDYKYRLQDMPAVPLRWYQYGFSLIKTDIMATESTKEHGKISIKAFYFSVFFRGFRGY
jgi:hypothetical protein